MGSVVRHRSPEVRKWLSNCPINPKLAPQVVFEIQEILFYFILAISRVILCHGSVGAEQMEENKNDKEEEESIGRCAGQRRFI